MRHIRAVSSHGAQSLAEAGIIAVIVLTLLASPALAAKGGGGGRPDPGTGAVLAVNPNPVSSYGAEYVVTGTGFKPDSNVNIVISMPTCCSFFTVVADSSGDMWFRAQTGDPGTYTVEAHQRLNNKRLNLVAQATFTVYAP